MDGSYPKLRGPVDAPIIARAVVRDFGPAGVEVSAGFCRRDPGEVELYNAWAGSEGLDERLVPGRPPGARAGVSARVLASSETDQERSARRARQAVRFACKALGVDRLITLTYRENMGDLARGKADFSAWARRVRQHYPGVRYVAVPELQERGAVHWHVGLRGFFDVNLLRALWYRTLGVRVARSELRCPPRLGPASPGSVQVEGPRSRGRRRRAWAPERAASYLSKYVGKGLGQFGHGRAYMVPLGVSRMYRTVRYYLRGEGRRDVACAFFDLLNAAGGRPVVWQSSDGMRLWGGAGAAPSFTGSGPG